MKPHAEFVICLPGRNLAMGTSVNIRVNSKHRAGDHSRRDGDIREFVALLFGLDVELPDPGFQSLDHFSGGFADAGENNVLGQHPRRQRPVELSSRHHISTIALSRQYLQHCKIGVSLHRKRDVRGIESRQRIAKALSVAFESRA